MAVVSLDLVGLFNNDVVRIRDAVKAAGVDVDHVIVQSTHVHETADEVNQALASPDARRPLARLKALGHEVEIDEAALTSHMRFAGDDDTRLLAISRAAASGADIIMPTRGGYGLTRLLKKLPYKAIAASIKAGSQWVGHSDFTALQMGLLAKTKAFSWAGPHAASSRARSRSSGAASCAA